MSEQIKRIILNVDRTNNGKITLEKPIHNIKKMRINDIVFNHGPKKKTRKKNRRKRDDDSDDSEGKYENGNPDLMDSTWIMLTIPDFIRGIYHDEDQLVRYTKRIGNDIDWDEDSGEGFWDRKVDDYDWYANHDNQFQKLENIEIQVSTNHDPSPTHMNFNMELELVTSVGQ